MATPIEKWSYADVANWLRRIGLENFVPLFAKHEINGEILSTMNESDLSAHPLNVTVFSVIRKFGKELQILKSQNISPPLSSDDGENLTDAAVQVSNVRNENVADGEILIPMKVENEILTTTTIKSEICAERRKNLTAIKVENCENVEQFFDSKMCAARDNEIQEESPNVVLPPPTPEPRSEEDLSDGHSNRAVMVKGTNLDRALENEIVLPEFCWRYQSNVEMIKQLNTDGVDAEIVVLISPVEFYVQPHFVMAKAQNLLTKMNDFYADDLEQIPADRVFENMPCAVKFPNEPGWFRAVVQEKGIEDARVTFIDWGNSQFTKYKDLKPLTTTFGRLPPLAIRCRIEGVRERALEQKVVQEFLAEIEDRDSKVKIVPVHIATHEKFLTVRLLDPKTNEDFGVKYLPKEPLCPKEEKISIESEEKIVQEIEEMVARVVKDYNRHDPLVIEEMKIKAEKLDRGIWKAMASDMEAFFDGAPDFDEANSDDENNKQKKKLKTVKQEILLKAHGLMPINERESLYAYDNVDYVQVYPKQVKPPKGSVVVYVLRVVSAREIYLRSELQKTCMASLENVVRSLHDNVGSIPLPDSHIKSGTACAFKDDDGRWYRAKIGDIDPTETLLPLVLVDYSQLVVADRHHCRLRIKSLRAESYLLNEYQLYKCKLHKLCDPPLTDVEASLLKELLPEGKKFNVHFDRDREPYRVILESVDDGKDFNETFEKEMTARGLDEIAARQRNSRFEVDVHHPWL